MPGVQSSEACGKVFFEKAFCCSWRRCVKSDKLPQVRRDGTNTYFIDSSKSADVCVRRQLTHLVYWIVKRYQQENVLTKWKWKLCQRKFPLVIWLCDATFSCKTKMIVGPWVTSETFNLTVTCISMHMDRSTDSPGYELELYSTLNYDFKSN